MVIREEESPTNLVLSTPGFSDFEGNYELKLLLILLTIDPSMSGILIHGATGTGKSLILQLFQQLKIPVISNSSCAYNCNPNGRMLCNKCLEKKNREENFEYRNSTVPLVKLPTHASLDSLVGSVDIKLKFRKGILGQVNNGILIVDDLHLLPQETMNILLNVWQLKKNSIQRNILSIEHPSNFCLISTFNSLNSEFSESWADKFAFSYQLHYSNSVKTRIEIMERNLVDITSIVGTTTNPTFNVSSKLIQEIVRARENLQQVKISSECISFIAKVCSHYKVDGVRADISLTKGARALASFQNRNYITKEDISFLIPYVLAHRIPLDNSDSIVQVIDKLTSTKKIEFEKNEFKNESTGKNQWITGFKHFLHKTIEYSVKIMTVIVTTYILSLIIAKILVVPRLLPIIFGLLLVWGISSFLLYLWMQRRLKLMNTYGLVVTKPPSPSNVNSFSQVKALRLSSPLREDKREFKKKIELELEEDRSNQGKILRFVGLQRRRGLISLSDKQRFWFMIYGLFILITSFVIYTVIIISVPAEFWITVFIFGFILFTIGYLRQLNQEKWKIKRAADVGTSPGETSKKISDQGIGSHISSTNYSPSIRNQLKYNETMINKLHSLDLMKENKEKPMGKSFMSDFDSKSPLYSSQNVLAERIPHQQGKIKSKRQILSGKRALSLSSQQTGRVIGDKPFKDFPRSLHVLATILNSIRRNPPHSDDRLRHSIQLHISDVREKVFSSRISAVIIFVLDLSQSIENTIKTVSSSVNWLSRQAYLYRDRVGIVILQGTQAVTIQSPTSNLNLVKRKLSQLRVSGSTPLPAGIQKAIELIRIERIRSKNEIIPMIILVTDGATNIPLLINPTTGVNRNIPLKSLGIDRAIKTSIEDSLVLAKEIKREKISLNIFSANIKGNQLFQNIIKETKQPAIEYLTTIISNVNLFQDREFIKLWSYALLRTMQEITSGNLFLLSRYITNENFETLRIARAEILSNIDR